MLDNEEGYYKAMLDRDFEEQGYTERDVKDNAVKVLEQTGYSSPVKALDENTPSSPFEDWTNEQMPRVRSEERNQGFERFEMNPMIDTPNGGRFPQSAPQEDPMMPSGSYKMGPIESAVDAVINPAPPTYPMTSTNQVPLAPISVPPLNQTLQQSGGASYSAKIPSFGKVPSTAPQAISTEEMAKRAKDTVEFANENIRGIPTYVDMSTNAKKAIAEGEKQVGDITTEAADLDYGELDKQYKQLEENEKNAQLEADEIGKTLATNVNPDRVWENKATWAKVALVLGAAIQGAAGSDAGLKLIENIIEKDINAQIDDRAKGVIKKGQLIDYVSQVAKNKTDVRRLMKEASMRIVDGLNKSISAGVKGQTAQEEAMKYAQEKFYIPNMKTKLEAEKNMATVQSAEQKYLDDDVKNALKSQEIQASAMDRALKKAEIQKLSVEEQKLSIAASNMAQTTKYMNDLENRKDFNPTRMVYTIQKYLADGQIPSGLSKDEAQYMASYDRYFTYFRQQVTGAAASETEEKRMRGFLVANQTNPKNALRIFQTSRDEIIANMVASMNPEAKVRLATIPEARKYLVNRSAIKDQAKKR